VAESQVDDEIRERLAIEDAVFFIAEVMRSLQDINDIFF